MLLTRPPYGAALAQLALTSATAGVLSLLGAGSAHAYSIYNGMYNGDALTVDLDTTVEYSNIFRVNNPSSAFLMDPNGNEGDSNFRHGLVSNELEVLPVFDVKDGNYGMHVSAEAYIIQFICSTTRVARMVSLIQ